MLSRNPMLLKRVNGSYCAKMGLAAYSTRVNLKAAMTLYLAAEVEARLSGARRQGIAGIFGSGCRRAS
jgi:urease accessory protein UreF